MLFVRLYDRQCPRYLPYRPTDCTDCTVIEKRNEILLPYLVPLLKNFDLFKVFSIGSVGIIEGSFKFPDVGLVLFLDTGNLGLVASFNLNKSSLEFLNSTLAALSEIQMFATFLFISNLS